MYQKRFYSALVLVFGLSATYSQCPSSFLITPCSCSLKEGQLPDLTCNGISNLRSLSDIFSRKFPTNEFHEIVVSGSRLGPLPNNVFQDKSFQVIRFSMNRLTSFSNKRIFSSSQSRLTNLIVIQETDQWTFDFDNIANFDKLSNLQLIGDEMKLTGTVRSSSLESLNLVSYSMTEFPRLGDLPSLQNLDLDANAIATLPPNLFASMPKLANLYLGHNKLVSLGSSALALTNTITTVDLSGNLINSLQKGWITGISSQTSLLLVDNYIQQIPREVFQTPVQSLLDPNGAQQGELVIDGNPLECGCDMAWLVTNSSLLSVVSGHCINGTRIANLNPTYFTDNC